MAQAVVQSGEDLFGETATASVTLNGCVIDNYIEVRTSLYAGPADAEGSISDGTHTYSLAARSKRDVGSGDCTAEVHYAKITANGNYTVTVTTSAGVGARYGWIWVGEISGRAGTSPLDSAATGTATGTSTSPAVTGAGSTTEANCMIVGVLSVATGTSDAGIDAATGNSLSWSNRIRKQDVNTEMGMAGDDAPAASTITPSVSWGTLSLTANWTALVVAFKDGAGGGGGGSNQVVKVERGRGVGRGLGRGIF